MQTENLGTKNHIATASLEAKMLVRFDKSEMDKFYEHFEPMDIQSCLDNVRKKKSVPEAA